MTDTWGWKPIEHFWQDLGYASRALWRTPAFTIAAVLTLSLGVGANTAMFSVVQAVILRPLPFAEPDRLVAVNETDLRSGTPRALSVSWPDFFDWRRDTQTLESMAGYHTSSFTVTGLGPSRHVPAPSSPRIYSPRSVSSHRWGADSATTKRTPVPMSS